MSIDNIKRATMQKIMRNLYFKIFFFTMLSYTAIGFLLIPYLIQHYLPTVLLSTLGTNATLYKTSFNPYTFELSLDQLVIQDDKTNRLASFNTLAVDFDVDDLIEGKLLFKKIYLQHLKVDIRIDQLGRYNFQHILDHIAASSSEAKVTEDTNSSLIGIRIPKLHIDDARIFFEDQSMGEPFSVKTRPFDFELKDFSTVFNEAGELHFVIATHESGSIESTATISLQPFGIQGDFSISDFNTNKLYSYIKENVDFKLDGHLVNMMFDYDLAYALGRFNLDVLNSNINVDRLFYSDANQTVGFVSLQSKIKGVHLSHEKDQLDLKVSAPDIVINDLNYTNTLGSVVSLETIESHLSSLTLQKVSTKDMTIGLHEYLIELQDLDYKDKVQSIKLGKLQTGFQQIELILNDGVESEMRLFSLLVDDLDYSDKRNALSIKDAMLEMPDLHLRKDLNVSAKIATFITDDIRLVNRNNKLLKMNAITVEDVSIDTSSQEYNITNVMLDKARINMRLYKDLTTDFNHIVTPSPKVKEETTVSSGIKPQLNIKDIWLKNSRFDFTDLRKKPIYLSVKRINTHIKDMTLDEKKSIPFSFSHATPRQGKVNGWGNVRLKPFALRLNLKVKRMDLRPYMPFVKPYVNLDLKSGYLSTAIEFRYQQNRQKKMMVRGDVSLQKIDLYHDIKKQRIMSVNAINVKAFSYKKDYLKIDRIVIDRPYNKIRIAEDKSTNLDGLVVVSKKKGSKEPKKSSVKKKSPFVYMLAEIKVKEGSMDFADLSLPLMFETHIEHLNGKIVAISSSPNETTQMHLDGVVDTYGLAEIDGKTITSQPTKKSNIKIDFKNIDVTAMSPYSGKFIGRKIQSGKLWLDLGYKIDDSQLKSTNKIKIKDLELGEEVESEEASSLPVGLAIALLKDQDGYIDVSVPVEGDVDDPEFKYGAAAWKAVGNLITGIVSSPFKFLGSAMGMDAEKMAQIGFDFGSVQLKAPEKEKLDQLLTLLAKRPELGLVITPSYHKERDTHVLQKQKLYDKALGQFKETEDYTSKYSLVKTLYIKSFSQEKFDRLYEKKKKSLQKGEDLEYLVFTSEVEALIAIQVVTPKELEALAKERSEVIRKYLVSKGLQEKFVNVSSSVKVEDTLVDDVFVMTLSVDVIK